MRPCNPVNRFLRSLKSLTKRRVLKETNIMLSLQNLSCFPYLLTHTMLSICLILALCYMHVQVAFHIWKFVHCNNIYLSRERCFLSGHVHKDHTRDKRKNIFISLTSSQKKIYHLSYSIDLYTCTFSTHLLWITKDQWEHSNQKQTTIDPLTPKIWLLILPSSCYTFTCKLVTRIWC